MEKKKIGNWNNYPIIEAAESTPKTIEELSEIVKKNEQLIARGNGRCYGDSSYSNIVVSTLSLNKILDFDIHNGILSCQSGVILDTILSEIVPKGFFLPVSPGTKYITIGGALASDIHGKNHHKDGNISNFVLDFDLMDEDGTISTIYPSDALFLSTVGGMGLTGIITRVRFRLKKIETSYIKLTSIQANGLKTVLDLMRQHQDTTYSVAWIDCLAKGKKLGRSVLLLGEHAILNDLPKKAKNNSLKLHSTNTIRIPFFFPSWVLSTLSVRLFNWLYYNKSIFSKFQIIHYNPYFYPLDGVNDWNKIYGKKGFIEYQFVLPFEYAEKGIEFVLTKIADSKLASFLCVIKLFGKNDHDRFLNFPKEGVTLAVDLKISNKLFDLLDELDTYITSLDGRVYLTKDARLKMDNYKLQYKEQIKPSTKFRSHQMIRLNQKQSNVLLVLGANSDIEKAYILMYAKKHPNAFLLLASRSSSELETFLKNNTIHNEFSLLVFDVEKIDSHKTFVNSLPILPSEVLFAAGYCPTNEECFEDTQIWLRNAMVNYVGAVSILNLISQQNNPFLKRIIGISSIAGMRGRKSNFLYGSTKSGFHQYLSGLRQELSGRNIIVQSLTPGAVRTKMTAHLKLPFFASNPEDLAKLMMQKKNKFQLYPNLLWKGISIIVRLVPMRILSKIN